MTITTTAGEKFTRAESVQMAQLVYKRFGRDLAAATAAWNRLLQNNCTATAFAILLEEGQPKAHERPHGGGPERRCPHGQLVTGERGYGCAECYLGSQS